MILLVSIFIGICLLAFMGFATFVLSTEYTQFKNNTNYSYTKEHKQSKTLVSKTLVAYFSRSKNTEVAAKAIAIKTNAQLLPIEAKAYEIGPTGWINANKDARKQSAEIQYSKLDLSKVDTLFIGSPIWWYSPAPPIWEFIKSQSLKDVKVVLFNTYNSKFEQQYIDAFAEIVKEKGGTFIGHIAVKRGRMGDQITLQSMIKKIHSKFDSLLLN